MKAASVDVAIVGAGIVGAACAMECASAGLGVAVIERDHVGSGATAAGMGHIVVMDDSDAQFALTRYSQELWNQLAPDLPRDVEYENCGALWVAADEAEMAEVHRKRLFYEARRVPVETLDAASLAAAEPHLRPGLAGALLVPDDSVVYAPCAAKFFLSRAMAEGATFHVGQPAVEISEQGVRLRDGTFISAGLTVNAGGVASPELAHEVPVKKRKGHLVITDRYPGFVRHQLVELGYLKSAHSLTTDSVAFNIQPRRTGQMLIGSSRQYDVEDSAVDTRMLRRMVERACEYLPELRTLSAIRVWTGFRPATPDRLPWIGPSPASARIFFATGHEGLGITTCLATARLLVDQLVKRDSAIPIGPYLPSPRRNEEAHA